MCQRGFKRFAGGREVDRKDVFSYIDIMNGERQGLRREFGVAGIELDEFAAEKEAVARCWCIV